MAKRNGGSPKSKIVAPINNTYKVYPSKFQVLEKILDRVYSKKSEASTQCDEYTIIQATISETETFKES